MLDEIFDKLKSKDKIFDKYPDVDGVINDLKDKEFDGSKLDNDVYGDNYSLIKALESHLYDKLIPTKYRKIVLDFAISTHENDKHLKQKDFEESKNRFLLQTNQNYDDVVRNILPKLDGYPKLRDLIGTPIGPDFIKFFINEVESNSSKSYLNDNENKIGELVSYLRKNNDKLINYGPDDYFEKLFKNVKGK